MVKSIAEDGNEEWAKLEKFVKKSPVSNYRCPWCYHQLKKGKNWVKKMRDHRGSCAMKPNPKRSFKLKNCENCLYATADPMNLKSHKYSCRKLQGKINSCTALPKKKIYRFSIPRYVKEGWEKMEKKKKIVIDLEWSKHLDKTTLRKNAQDITNDDCGEIIQMAATKIDPDAKQITPFYNEYFTALEGIDVNASLHHHITSGVIGAHNRDQRRVFRFNDFLRVIKGECLENQLYAFNSKMDNAHLRKAGSAIRLREVEEGWKEKWNSLENFPKSLEAQADALGIHCFDTPAPHDANFDSQLAAHVWVARYSNIDKQRQQLEAWRDNNGGSEKWSKELTQHLKNVGRRLQRKQQTFEMVIELCCGIGRFAGFFMNIVEADSYLGVDKSSDMCEAARERWESTGNINFENNSALSFMKSNTPKNALIVDLWGLNYTLLDSLEDAEDLIKHFGKALNRNCGILMLVTVDADGEGLNEMKPLPKRLLAKLADSCGRAVVQGWLPTSVDGFSSSRFLYFKDN